VIPRLRSFRDDIASKRKPGSEAKKIFIRDFHLPFRLAESEKEAAGVDFDFDWSRGLSFEAQKEKTKEAAAVVELVPPGFSSVYSRRSFSPFIQLKVGEEDELRKWSHINDDTTRKEMNDFFVKQASSYK
jgi:hypothetical protein